MARILLALIVALPNAPAAIGTQWYVSTDAAASGCGTFTNPWQLDVALRHPAAVQPGDTIWLRGGLYNGKVGKGWDSLLTGTAAAPILVRNYGNERAILNDQTGDGGDDPLQAYGAYTWYWGLEFQCNSNNSGWADGASALGSYLKFINCIAHDVMGVGFWSPTSAIGTEIYGNLAFFNGRTQVTHNKGYGIYAQNTAGTRKKIIDNVFYDQWGNYAIHLYTQTRGRLIDFDVEGNIIVNNTLYMGSASTALENSQFSANYVYTGPDKISGSVSVDFGGYPFGAEFGIVGLTIISNYFAVGGAPPDNVGTVAFQSPYRNLTVLGNTVYGSLVGIDPADFPNNSYYIGEQPSPPTKTAVFVRPNQYEPGRAHIAVFNWEKASTVKVDVASVKRFHLGTDRGTGSLLNVGDSYEIRDIQDYFGSPIASGTYSGVPISVPMISKTVAKPFGKATPPHTSVEFGAFVIIRRSASGASCDAVGPSISMIPDVLMPGSVSSTNFSFTVDDEEIAPDSLSLTVDSSNTALIPVSQIVLTGSGENRTIAITLTKHQNGSSIMTVRAAYGVRSSSSKFVVTVLAEGASYIVAEAESAVLTPPAVLVSDNCDGSGGRYAVSKVANNGDVEFRIKVPQKGDWVIWCRTKSETRSGSFEIVVDGLLEGTIKSTSSYGATNWHWDLAQERVPESCAPRDLTIGPGAHRIKLFVREPETALDAILVTNDRASPFAEENVVVNGNFQSEFAGWMATGNQRVVLWADTLVPGAFSDFNVVQFGYSKAPPNAVLSQGFLTIAGLQYVLTLAVGAFSAANNEQEQITVDLAGTSLVASLSIPLLAQSDKMGWRTNSLSFTADSMLTMVILKNTTAAIRYADMYLRSVDVREQPRGSRLVRLLNPIVERQGELQAPGSQVCVIRWNGAFPERYQVGRSEDLKNWKWFPAIRPYAAGPIEFEDYDAPLGRALYRVLASE